MTAPPPPKVLIVDDVLGADSDERGKFCDAMWLRDASTTSSTNKNFVADVTFVSGQRESEEGAKENDLTAVMTAIRNGWIGKEAPQDRRWALVCLDINFSVGKSRPRDERFGYEILERVCMDPDLVGLPVVMLSTADAKEERGRPPLDRCGTDPAIFAKWTSRSQMKNPQQFFSQMLYVEGLLEDGAWHAGRDREAGALRNQAEDRIIGKSPALLRCLRLARAIVTRDQNKGVYIKGSRGDWSNRTLDYLAQHRNAYCGPNSGIKFEILGGEKLKASYRPSSPPRGVTLIDAHLLSPDESSVFHRLRREARKTIVSGQEPIDYLPQVVYPAMGDRREDVAMILSARLDGFTLREGALTALERHKWPRNEEEVEAVGQFLAGVCASKQVVTAQDVETAVYDGHTGPVDAPKPLTLETFLAILNNFQLAPSDTDGTWKKLRPGLARIFKSMTEAALERHGSEAAAARKFGILNGTATEETTQWRNWVKRWNKELNTPLSGSN